MQEESFSLEPLISVLRDQFGADEDTFEDVINPFLQEYKQIRNDLLLNEAEVDEHVKIIPLTCIRSDTYWLLLPFIGTCRG